MCGVALVTLLTLENKLKPVAELEEVVFVQFVDLKSAILGILTKLAFIKSKVKSKLKTRKQMYKIHIARRYVKFATFIYMLFMIGMFLPDGSIPRWRFIFRMGLYDTRLGYMLTLVGGGGLTLLMFVSYIRSLPKDFDEAAMIDGCGYLQFIFKILLPLMKPALASMGVLQAIGIWNEVTNSVIYFSNKNYFPITRGLYVFRSDYSVKWPELTAALVIIAVPMIVLYTFLQKYIIDGIVSGGVKA